MARSQKAPVTWPGRELPTEYRKVAQMLVRDQGWTYLYGGNGGYPILRDPEGRGQTSLARTPSDHRSFQNWLSQLRGLGACLDLSATPASTVQRREAAAAEVAAHEEKLRQLAETIERTGAHPLLLEEARASVALDRDETHVVGEPRQPGQRVSAEEVAEFVARSTEASGVPLKVEDPEALATVATLLGPRTVQPIRPKPMTEARKEALSLLMQGYHVDRVAARTGLSVQDLQHVVGDDGYHR